MKKFFKDENINECIYELILALVPLFLIVVFIACLCIISNSMSKTRNMQQASEMTEEKVTDIPSGDSLHGAFKVKDLDTFRNYRKPSDFRPVDCTLSEDIQEYTYFICQAYDIDFYFFMAIMQVESNFDETAIGRGCDFGLMQINKCNHDSLSKTLGITDFLDPHQNILAGAYVIASLFERIGEFPDQVLMAYNMGENGARVLWNQGIFTTPYTRKVFDTMAEMAVIE